MPDITEAYTKLLAIAQEGPEYRRDQVFHVQPDAADGADIVGRGRDFETTVQVIDHEGVPSIAGNVALRLLGLREPDGDTSLFLRTRLDWETGVGKHSSFASYIINVAATQSLAEAARNPVPEPTEAEIAELLEQEGGLRAVLKMISNDQSATAACRAQWDQTYPGSNVYFGEPGGLVDSDGNPDLDAITASAEYHERAVLAAREAEPELLTMLSDSLFGSVAPQELPDLLSWVERNHHQATN